MFLLTSRTIHNMIIKETCSMQWISKKEGISMKNKGLLLILAGVVVILAGIAIYGYVSVNAADKLPTAVNAQVADGSLNSVGFDAAYDMLAATGQTDVLLTNSAFLNFLIRYRMVFLIAAIVAFAGSAVVGILPRRKAKAA